MSYIIRKATTIIFTDEMQWMSEKRGDYNLLWWTCVFGTMDVTLPEPDNGLPHWAVTIGIGAAVYEKWNVCRGCALRSGLSVLADWSMWWLSRGGLRQLARLLYCDGAGLSYDAAKKNKKTTWLVATVTTIIAPSKGSVREIYIQWKVAMMFRCLRLLLCAYARGYALLHNTVIQPLFLVFFLNNPVKRQRGSVFIMAVC